MDELDQALRGQTRASEWREMRKTLAQRLRVLREQRSAMADGPEAAATDKEIARLDEQVTTLRTEEAVAQFVEDSVRFGIGSARIREDFDVQDSD